ncbi:MAG: agmatinase [Candidatus Sericytochromatia bacterium]|nr:agmatinase [Candidatus Sericytochromatia bacterium]
MPEQINAVNFGGFLGLGPELTNLENAQVVIIPVPYEATTSYRGGTKDGPAAIIAASPQIEMYDDELECEPCDVGIATLEPLHIDRRDYVQPIKDTRTRTAAVMDLGKFPIILGGEHSLSLGCIEEGRARYPDLTILHFDAHADLRDEYENTPHSHACIMRRVVEQGIPSVSVGIRNISIGEAEWVRETKPPINFHWGRDFFEKPLDTIISEILGQLGDNVWLTFDVDGLDPSIMPATGTPEPGGLLWYQVCAIMKKVFEKKHIVGADVTELAPMPGNHAPDFLVAKLVYKIIGYKFHAKRIAQKAKPTVGFLAR